jgi:ASC-1-like (ASCH) protein
MTYKAPLHFRIKPEWEEAIKEGKKRFDVRINAKPYADVNKGDIIKYSSIKVQVKRIYAYPGVADLLSHEDYKKIVPEAKDNKEAMAKLLVELHHNEPPHGILAFEIEPYVEKD